MNEFTLGQRVRFTHPLVRRHVYPARKIEVPWAGASSTYTKHINKEWAPNEFAQPAEGIVIGKRTLANGLATWEEEGSPFAPAEHFTAYMIVTGLRSAPVHVLPEHITAMEDEEPKVCPYDCDSCHDEDCPCDRLGCAGSEAPGAR